MKARYAKPTSALTLIELLVVVAIIGILLLIILPGTPGRPRNGQLIYCQSNLRQIGLAHSMWLEEHGYQFPWQVSVTNGGTLELPASTPTAQHFQVLSNYLVQPKIFICPTDKQKKSATNYASFNNANVSYFINLAVTTNGPVSYFILTGDRHLQINSNPVTPGVVTITSNTVVEWSKELHTKNPKSGCLGFADGHVETVTANNLSLKFQKSINNRIAIP